MAANRCVRYGFLRGAGLAALLLLSLAEGAAAQGVPAPATPGPSPSPAPDPEERLEERIIEWSRGFAPRPSDAPPPGAHEGETPLFRFVVLADIHHTVARHALLLQALAYVRDAIRPDFVLLAGDNISGATPAHQAELRRTLDEGLPCPYRLVQGDNDSQNYTEVFGTSDWAATYMGVRFVGVGLDADSPGAGIGLFDEETYGWLRDDFARHPTAPTVLLTHTPILPPSFLSSGRCLLLLAAHRQAFMVLGGHLHYDQDIDFAGVRHLSCPGLGPNPAHPLKEFLVFPDAIVARTHELRPDGYAFANTWQVIPFPVGLAPDASAPHAFVDPHDMPPRPTTYPPELSRFNDRFQAAVRRIAERFAR